MDSLDTLVKRFILYNDQLALLRLIHNYQNVNTTVEVCGRKYKVMIKGSNVSIIPFI